MANNRSGGRGQRPGRMQHRNAIRPLTNDGSSTALLQASGYSAHVLRRENGLTADFLQATPQYQQSGYQVNPITEIDTAEPDPDPFGIVVSPLEEVNFGVVAKKDTPSAQVTIRTTKSHRDVRLVAVRVKPSELVGEQQRHRQSSHFTLTWAESWIEPQRPHIVEVSFKPPYDGLFEEVLQLFFHELSSDQLFVITRHLCATVGSKEDHAILKARGSYLKRKYVPLSRNDPVIHSTRPPVWTRTQWKHMLPPFQPPKKILDAVYHPRAGANVAKRFIPALSVQGYGKYFSVLVHIEAEYHCRELEKQAMHGVTLVSNYPRYNLAVPRIAQRQPRILVGDYIHARRSSTTEGPWTEGRVHKVTESALSLRFPDDFNIYKENSFDIRFVFNTLPFRRMLQAVTAPFDQIRILFPDVGHPGTERVVNAISSITSDAFISSNEEQLQTVNAIVSQPAGSVPFVIFGPPGTGKTTTLAEAIRQLLGQNPNNRILACAPSNTAADVIAEKLTSLGPAQLFRLNSLSRPVADLSSSLKDFSLINDNVVFAIPPLVVLQKYRVIVSTCVSGGIPFGLGFQKGFFSHIFIDEAGQATEPEAMIPIKTMTDENTNVVIAGDHKQLGPSILSRIGSELGLKNSYLHRLTSRVVYDLNEWSGITIVKLVKCFRSHPKIIHTSNMLFYEGQLRPSGARAITHSLLQSDVLVKKGFPIVFHGVVGKEEQESSSPSYFNISEASVVKEYCEKLTQKVRMRTKRNRKRQEPAQEGQVRQEQIGIITPYSAQKWKITDLIQSHQNLSKEKIKIGSVEEFQGRERRVIILSTVRSSTANKNDIKATLGFVSDAARFNVAITRAQAMLIVIGNPHVLRLDPNWRVFLEYVHSSGGWRGEPISWAPDVSDGGSDGLARVAGEVEEDIQRIRAHIRVAENDIVV